ncbi:hypothetical protein FB45DRAFT_1063460 [Roridomyces roridus]|uniref:F-box domain-containing protein n=1 Tax=Roridomyces roridus TaxID=1738132 RepID=A0AAD7BDF9_9AGAR|nr:hypothetical protein FB45DRAFT_1063460 [Roridomyces roridus]
MPYTGHPEVTAPLAWLQLTQQASRAVILLFISWHPDLKMAFPCTRMTRTIEILPDEVLAIIFKVFSDAPAHPAARPASITTARVNRRWRTITLQSPELWTTIHISHRPRSLHWAALSIARSQSLPLDISINLEGYLRKPRDVNRFHPPDYPAYVSLEKILPIVAPHLLRWRTVAFRGWPFHVAHFEQFISSAPPGSTSSIESLHLSNAETWWCTYGEPTSVSLPRLYHLRALKLDGFGSDLGVLLQPACMLQALDIDLQQEEVGFELLRPLLQNPATQLRTLVLRGFWLYPRIQHPPIEAYSLRCLAVSLYSARYWGSNDGGYAGFKTVTALFDMPNLERLEILGGFHGDDKTEKELMEVYGPAVWNPPLLACLRELRLQDVCFSRANVELMHSVTRGISHLELIDTRGNQHLLHSGLWPGLRDITVESVDNAWIVRFVSMRAVQDLVLRLLPTSTATILFQPERAPSIRWLCDGPSHTLFDNISPSGHGFYLDAADGPVDFEYGIVHPRWCGCREREDDCPHCGAMWGSLQWDEYAAEMELEINEAFKTMASIRRERQRRVAWRKKRPDDRARRRSGQIDGNGRRRIDIGEDFVL